MKKLFASLVALMLTLALALPASAANSAFSDVTYNNWAYPYVQRAAGEGWVSGVGGGRFAPNSQVTGAEFVTMVTRAFYLSDCQEAAPGQAWYQGYVNAAQSHGLLTHGINTSSVLNSSLNRYNMAVVLYNLAEDNGMLTSTGNGFLSQDGSKEWSYRTAQSSIADWSSIPTQYRDPVLACYALGILSGTDGKGTFSGSSAMTRSQAAVVLCKTDDDAAATAPTTGVTKEQAQQIALEDAGVAQSSVTFVRVYEDWENGRSVYEVEFYVNGKEYDYEIEKSTGKIISRDWDIEGWVPSTPGSGSTGSPVTLDQAKQIALQDAGVAQSSATFIRAYEDWDDGRSVYEVEFYANGKEYDYEIEKSTGKILSSDWDIENWAPSAPGSGSTGSPITLNEAKQLVLDKVPGMSSSSVWIQQEWDDGRLVYEGEARYNGVEYDFEIDANTGRFLDWDPEPLWH
ncbi:MAG: PepSY domain-containing protein [Acutalibacter sp.]|jgi:uncharacterized membrane protein YkoI